ncbi:hypothetical protein ELT15_16715 [Escherichia coli]|nr:hypothetical protein ELT15_16715 [Escherichia coli]
MQDIYNRKNYTMIPRVSVCIKTLFTLKKQLRCNWICPYISRHLLSLNPLQARCRRYSRGER